MVAGLQVEEGHAPGGAIPRRRQRQVEHQEGPAIHDRQTRLAALEDLVGFRQHGQGHAEGGTQSVDRGLAPSTVRVWLVQVPGKFRQLLKCQPIREPSPFFASNSLGAATSRSRSASRRFSFAFSAVNSLSR